ncbi:unnamed protein product [Rotaria sp. Silwood2]|nr:unnamed protein product [Rotaria sp. Silwood2]
MLVVSATSKTTAELVKEGCALAKDGTPNTFLNAIKKFSEINPPAVDALYLRGNAHLKVGGPKHNQQAIDDFSKALSLYDNSNEKPSVSKLRIYYKRAWVHHVLGEYDQALSDYSELINRARCSKEQDYKDFLSKGYISRGLVYESMQLLHKALADIEEGKKWAQHPNNPYYNYCLERVRITLKERQNELDDDEDVEDTEQDSENDNDKDDKSKEEDEQVRCQIPPSEDIGKKMTTESKNAKYDENYYHALLLSEQGNNMKALENFKQAFSSTTNDSQKAECLFRQGLCQYQLGQKDAAQNLFEQAQKCDPKHARNVFRLGMMQAADRNYKEAIQTLTTACKYAPNSVDILYERASIFEKLGRLDEAMYDRRRAMQLGRSVSATVIILQDRLRQLKAEVLQQGESAIRRLKMGWVQEALHQFQKETTSVHEEMGKLKKVVERNYEVYNEAVKEYRMAIETDVEQLCPEAHALLALCQRKEKDYLPAHDALENLFKMLIDSPDSMQMWKSFVKMIKKDSYWNDMGVAPSEKKMNEIKQLDADWRGIAKDERSFQGDENNNRLLFYRKFRIQLSNILAAFALAGCDEEILSHNLKGSYHK